jgi:uncharacterized protein (DUF2344 family)
MGFLFGLLGADASKRIYERASVPVHYTASFVSHHAQSANKLTYGAYSAGLSDVEKRWIVGGIKVAKRVVAVTLEPNL